jgi:hypothetical protein
LARRVKVKKKHGLTALYFVAITALVVATYFGYRTKSESLPYQRNFSIINLRNEKIIVESDDNLVELEHFDILNLEEEIRSDPQKYIIRNTDGNFYGEFEIKRDVSANTLEIIPVTEQKFCYFQADVSDIYYQNDISSLRGIKLISDGAELERYTRVLDSDVIYVYPGKSLKDELPQYIDSTQKVIGIYPIECSKGADQNALLETVLFYKNYNAEEQREFYEERLEEIENLRL